MNVGFIRRLLLGERLPTARAIHERLPKFLALPVFASDAISSLGYAPEEILLALVLAGSAAVHYSLSVALAICILFAIVGFSYRQTIIAYPSGGGAYIVARENLGLFAGILAASALMTDYILTVSVSISSGMDAIVSAMPELHAVRVPLCLLLIALIALANLRGARESGWLFAGPTYLFIGIVAVMLVVGFVRVLFDLGPAEEVRTAANTMLPVVQPLTLFLVLRAFASGCAALTGTEAISNAVQAFQPAESRNAALTLVWMLVICIILFFGVAVLTQSFHIIPDLPADKPGRETVVSTLGRAVFGVGPFYYILQFATAMILVLAANTSFAGFPRLASILARDRLAPRQLFNLGDRLVFNNGILLLGAFSALLIVIFRGVTHSLIPLYAVGVFLSFTLSQAGMVVHWHKLKTPGWRWRAVINAIGAIATGLVLFVVAIVKFLGGAYIVMVVIPALVILIGKVHRHYLKLGAALRVSPGSSLPRAVRHHVLVLIPGMHRGVVNAVLYAKSISDAPEAVYVEVDPAETPLVQERWEQLNLGIPLTILKSPWRSLTEPILQYIRTVRQERHVDMVTVVLPEFATTKWWHRLLHNQTGLLLKFALMFEPGVVVSNVRYHVKEE